MKLSYFARNYLRIFDQEGKSRSVNENEIRFIQMIEQAMEHDCDIAVMHGLRGKDIMCLVKRKTQVVDVPETATIRHTYKPGGHIA